MEKNKKGSLCTHVMPYRVKTSEEKGEVKKGSLCSKIMNENDPIWQAFKIWFADTWHVEKMENKHFFEASWIAYKAGYDTQKNCSVCQEEGLSQCHICKVTVCADCLCDYVCPKCLQL